MAHANLEYRVLFYEDPSTTSPKVRDADIDREQNGLSISRPKGDSVDLMPGDSETILSTVRALTQDTTTQYALSRPQAALDVIRLAWTGTGTAPGFRTGRALATDATTVVAMTRIAPNTVRIQATAGTPITTTAVQVGDFIKFERNTDSFTSAFNAANAGQTWKIQNVGTGYLDFLDNGQASLDTGITLGASFAQQFLVMSPGPVKIGDTLSLGAGLNLGNQGAFQISAVSPGYVEFTNAYEVDQTFTQSNNVFVYDRLTALVLMRAHGPFSVQVNDQTTGAPVAMLGQEAVYLASLAAYKITVSNNGQNPITVTVTYASPGPVC